MRQLSRLAIACALLTPAIAHAGEPSTAATAATAEPSSYRLPLALAYFLPVSVATVGAFALSSPGHYVTGISGAVGMVAAPPLVHGVHDNGAAAASALLGTLASISAGAVVGAGISIASGYEPKNADDGVGRVGGAAILGGLIGAAVGYLAWGAFDVIEHGEVASPSRGDTASVIRSPVPWWQPIFAAERNGALEMAGVSVGLAGEF